MRLPDLTQRMMICGRTGSGKTVFGAWALSQAPFDQQPFVIVNHKMDALLAGLPRVKTIGLHEKLPKEPGVYQVFPLPSDEDALEKWMWKVWHKGGIGLFFDEGYMIPRLSAGFRALMTQGRSLHIPVTILSQKPKFISPFIISESDYYAVFHLNDGRDYERIAEFTPPDQVWNPETKLEKYWSRWYDVGDDLSTLLRPAPAGDVISETFEQRLKPRRKWM